MAECGPPLFAAAVRGRKSTLTDLGVDPASGNAPPDSSRRMVAFAGWL